MDRHRATAHVAIAQHHAQKIRLRPENLKAYLIYTVVQKTVYHPTFHNIFDNRCPISVICVQLLLSKYAIKTQKVV